MNRNKWIRQIQRWLSIVFTAGVIAESVVKDSDGRLLVS